jgi:hypothetical protein
MKMKKKKEKRKEIYNKKGNQEKHVPSCRRLDPTAPPSERTSPRPQDACQPVHGFGTLIRIALFSRRIGSGHSDFGPDESQPLRRGGVWGRKEKISRKFRDSLKQV